MYRYIAWRYLRGRTGQVSSTPLIAYNHVIFTSRSYQKGDHCWGKCVIAGDLHVLTADVGLLKSTHECEGEGCATPSPMKK